jgi:hypothetical protein
VRRGGSYMSVCACVEEIMRRTRDAEWRTCADRVDIWFCGRAGRLMGGAPGSVVRGNFSHRPSAITPSGRAGACSRSLSAAPAETVYYCH